MEHQSGEIGVRVVSWSQDGEKEMGLEEDIQEKMMQNIAKVS
jgi:hypothetical protein